ncbi:hypothetical protein H5410_005471 [Solanum commersonii]|uniref:Uncharacterized protein n=1 Tax=Solanum commersonii TaxID=4109 RepID=A0A9J6A6P8_SOLCO|nr:hypothetical protein H5410_005471 [Solanum commersonii]
MTRSSSKEVIEYNPELEKTLRLLKKELAERVSQQPQGFNTMGDINAGNRGLNDPVNLNNPNHGLGIEDDAENPGVVNRRIHCLPVEVEDQMDQNNGRTGRLLEDYAKPNYNGMQSSVKCPPVAANNFEIKHSVLQAIQNNCVFRGKQNEDPTKPWLQLTNFWEGLSPASRRILNNAVGGPIMKKTAEEAIEILDELAEDANQWVVENSKRKKSAGVHQVDTYTTLQAQIASIAKDVKQLTFAQAQMTQSIICDFCTGGHPTHECQQVPLVEEEVNVVGNYNRGNNFNAMGQKHHGFLWSAPNGSLNAWQQNNARGQGQATQGYQNYQRQQYQPQQGQQGNQSNLEEMFKSFITKVDEKFENQNASIRNLEKQVGQIANQISERTPGTLPSDTVRNPKDLKAVTLRSGKMLSEICQSPKEKSRESQVETKESHEIKKGLKVDSAQIPFERSVTSHNRGRRAAKPAQTRPARISRSVFVSPRDRVGRSFNRVISARASHQIRE